MRLRRSRACDAQPTLAPALLWPSVGASVRLAAEEAHVDCVVAAHDEGSLEVELPGGGFLIDDGAHVTVEWPNGHGVTSVRAGVETLGLGRWRLEPVSGIREHQRRAFVRVGVGVKVTIRHGADSVLYAFTSDVSEGGVSLHLEDEQCPPCMGERLRMQLLMGGQVVRVRAEVVRVRELEDGMDVGCRFLDPYPADFIRGWVLQMQRRQRQVHRQPA